MVDVYPTLADLCNLKAPADVEGVSLRPLLDAPGREWKKGAFTQVTHGRKGGRIDGQKGRSASVGRSLRTERYRYTEWGEGQDGAELYDHDSDPLELRNLAADPKAAAVVQELKTMLHGGWQAARPR